MPIRTSIRKVWTTAAFVALAVALAGGCDVDYHPDQPEEISQGLPGVTGNPNVKQTYVVSAGDLQESGGGQNVIIGYIDLYTDTYSFSGNTGPRAVFSFWRWSRGDYPSNSCNAGSISPYDHTSVYIGRNCPPPRPGGHSHWSSCPVHVQPGWGSGPPIVLNGIWSASSTELHFSWNVGGVKKKDYWFIRKKKPTIHYLELDGLRTNGADSYWPSERTHGFAFGSNRRFTQGQPLSAVMYAFGYQNFEGKTFTWLKADATTEIQQSSNAAYSSCIPDQLWYYSYCYSPVGEKYCEAADKHSHTQECWNSGPGKRGKWLENTSYWADPWPLVNDRKNAQWMWRSCHAKQGETCYHGRSHALPMVQALDDNGIFYGWVGVEHHGTGPDLTDSLLVIRWARNDLLP